MVSGQQEKWPQALGRALWINRVAVHRSRLYDKALFSFRVLPANRGKERADERTRTAFLLITSDNSYVAGTCRGLQIPHFKAAFSAPACRVLHRIAFPVVSEWYQKSPWDSQHRFFCKPDSRSRHDAPLRAATYQAPQLGVTTCHSLAARIRRPRPHESVPAMAGPLGEVGFANSGAQIESSVVSEMRGRRSC